MSEFLHINVQETQKMMQHDNAVIVDIRDEQSFVEGHMPSEFHLTNGSMHQFTQQTEYEQPVIVVCYHGISSQQAAQFLINHGFEQVYSMDGGFEAWRQQFPSHIGRAD